MLKALKFWRKLTTHPDFWGLFFVLLLGYLAAKPLFGAGYFNMHDDLQMMRQLQMEKCFIDGQIPCRWVPDMGYGFGFPLFNFYPPLPYLVGQIFRVVGFSFVDTAKALFIFAFMASGVSMYALAKQFFGRLGGVLSAAFYIWAPYHAVDRYVRGAMNEAWALIFFPIILLFSYKLINRKSKQDIILLGLAWFGLLTSHNLMVLIFTPIFAVWCLIWIAKNKAWMQIKDLILAGILAFGLAAFFTLPVFLEQKLVHADTLVVGYYEYTAHFATISQILFSRFWGYGPSVWMDADDKMSFQIGHFHWIGSIVIILFSAIYFLRKRKLPPWLLATVLFILVGWFAALMTHSKSTPLWQMIDQLKFVQFPWRFLTLVIFGFSFAIGAVTQLFSKKIILPVVAILCVGVVLFNLDFFDVEKGMLGPLTDSEKFAGAAWDLQRTAGIYDYLPKTARQNPRDGQSTLAESVRGIVEISNAKQGTNWAQFDIDAKEDSQIRINIYQFPNWKVFVDGKEVENYVPEKELWGRMHIDVSAGKHEVYAKLYDTPVRIVGNIISLLTWVFLGLILVRSRFKLFQAS